MSYTNIQTVPNISFDRLVKYESEIIKCNSKKIGADIAMISIVYLAILHLF